jgi:hypothetical protein
LTRGLLFIRYSFSGVAVFKAANLNSSIAPIPNKVSVVFLLIGAFNVDGGYLWVATLVMGGVFFGHVVTEALNEK